MATIYRKTVNKALPDGAELIELKGERRAHWKRAKGRMRTAGYGTEQGAAPREQSLLPDAADKLAKHFGVNVSRNASLPRRHEQ